MNELWMVLAGYGLRMALAVLREQYPDARDMIDKMVRAAAEGPAERFDEATLRLLILELLKTRSDKLRESAERRLVDEEQKFRVEHPTTR